MDEQPVDRRACLKRKSDRLHEARERCNAIANERIREVAASLAIGKRVDTHVLVMDDGRCHVKLLLELRGEWSYEPTQVKYGCEREVDLLDDAKWRENGNRALSEMVAEVRAAMAEDYLKVMESFPKVAAPQPTTSPTTSAPKKKTFWGRLRAGAARWAYTSR